MNRSILNLGVLYFVHFSNYLFPLLLLPYLSRVLGPLEWGKVVLATSLGSYIFMFVEYGFTFSATREVAARKDDPPALQGLFWSVIWGKVLLALVVLAVGSVIFFLFPDRIPEKFVLPAFLWGSAQGMNFIWFFQGLEKMYFPAMVEFFSKALNLAGVFLLVREPTDSWRVLVITATASLVSLIICLLTATRTVGWRRPVFQDIVGRIKDGFNIFVFQITCSFYTVLNPLLLGYLNGVDSVGFFAGAEKIVKSLISLVAPIGNVLYPKFSHSVSQNPPHAIKLARRCLAFYSILAVLMSGGIFLFADKLVLLLLGSKFLPSIDFLKILALLPMASILSQFLSIQWTFPLRLDWIVNYAVAFAGVLHLSLAFILVPRVGIQGMCLTLLCSEFFTLVFVATFLFREGLDPLRVTEEKLISLKSSEPPFEPEAPPGQL